MMAEQPHGHDPDNLPQGTLVCGEQYVIEACLGRGGVATVYRVQTSDGRRLALKLMVTRRAADGDQRERFDNEWRILRALHGLPYVVAVQQHGRHDDGRPFFTMELCEGPTLADLIVDRDVTVARACWVAREVAHALDDLHTRGVIHRDIKPENIMVTADGIRLLDFGYAYTRGSEQVPSLAGLTTSEHRPGTPLYMAPEQADGAAPTPSFDLYALAVTLYEALVGHAPNSELSPALMMAHKCRGGPEELSIDGRMAGLRRGLVQLVDHGLRRDPAERVPSAAEFRDRLDAVLEEMGDEDFPAGIQDRPVRAVGVIEEVEADRTMPFLPAHLVAAQQRAAQVSTEKVPREEGRVQPLRPAIGGGRGDTKPVPRAWVSGTEGANGAVAPDEPSEPSEPSEVQALREAAEQAAATARHAEQRVSPEVEARIDESVAQRHTTIIPPEHREATLARMEATKAAEALEAARQAHAKAQAREAEAARSGVRQASSSGVLTTPPRAEAEPSERRPLLGALGSKAWAAAVAVLLVVVGLAWWGLRDEPQPEPMPPEAAGGVAAEAEPKVGPEPKTAPEPKPEPEPKVEPEPKPEPEPKVEPEPEPESQPEPEPQAEPKRTKPPRKTKPPRQAPPKPEPKPDEPPCTDVAAEAKTASRGKQWSRVLKLTKSSRCWDDEVNRKRLRVRALLESGRLVECVKLGSADGDPDVQRMATRCSRQLEEEGTP